MSAHLTQKLWSQLWEPAFTIAFKPRQPLRSSFQGQVFSPASKRGFSQSRPKLHHAAPRRRSVLKSFAPCGFLFFDISSPATASPAAITSCVTAAEKSLYSTTSLRNMPITSLAASAWTRGIHSSSRRRERGNTKRMKSSTSGGQTGRKLPQDPKSVPPTKKPETPHEDVSNSYIHLPHMPKMPHRPTKEELLAAATGFWSRLKVRFKWFSIRSSRPWNVDDWSAFVSWFVLGNIAWVFIGTTTFFSLVILSINTVVAQGMSNVGDE